MFSNANLLRVSISKLCRKSAIDESGLWSFFILMLHWAVMTNTAAFGQTHFATQAEANRFKPLVLFDAYHAHTWIETPPHEELDNYHILHSLARAADALRQQGFECESQLGPWTPTALSRAKAIVINLVSADRAPFSREEVDSIVKYIRAGGGLFLVTDHTNCYYHNHVLHDLAEQIDYRLRDELLCDKEPYTSGTGNGWIRIARFNDHPTTRGINNVGFQSGGLVDSRYSIAFSSEESWADLPYIPPYGESNHPGFFGNFKQEIEEPSGSQPAIAAFSVGDGNVFVIADQNAIGGMYLNFFDNKRLWLQAIYWLTKTPLQEDSSLLQSETNRPLVWAVESLPADTGSFTDTSNDGFYRLTGWLNKVADCRVNNTVSTPPDFILIADWDRLTATEKAEIELNFQRGSHVMILTIPKDIKRLESWTISMQVSPSDKKWDTIWEVWSSNGDAMIFVLKEPGYFRNEHLPTPETSISPSHRKRFDQIKTIFSNCNLRLFKFEDRGLNWLNDLDREDLDHDNFNSPSLERDK